VHTLESPVIAVLLLFFPLGAAAVALALARRLAAPDRALLAVAALLLVASAIASPIAPVHDPWTHYLHLRAALSDPARLLDPWDRPGFTLLAAGPAALGIRAARLAAIATALVALAATARAAGALGIRRPWLAAALLLAQYDFFGEATSTMTELPFAAALAIAVLGWAEDRPWVVAAGLGWLAITRPEGPAFAALGALGIALRWRRAGPALAVGLPFALWFAAGAALFGDARWLATRNPYRTLVAVRIGAAELGRSYFFEALWLSQGPVLALLELAGALLAAAGPARRLRFLLAPALASFLLLTFLRIGATDAWRESRYLVTIGPALALLAATAIERALAAHPRLAPPLLLAASALAAAWTTCWHWGQIGAWHGGLLETLASVGLALAALLWLARRRVSPAVATCVLLLLPLVTVPPGILSRHRADVPPGAPPPQDVSPTTSTDGPESDAEGEPASARHDPRDDVLLGRAGPATVAVARRDPERAVRSLHHLADPPEPTGRVALEVDLVRRDPAVGPEHDAVQVTRAERADEEGPLPRRHGVAPVDAAAAWGHRLDERERGRDRPRARLAPPDVGPAEVLARARDGHLVAALTPELAGRTVVRDDERPRVEPVERLDVAHPAQEHGAPRGRVVVGDLAVGPDPQDLPVRSARVLRRRGNARVAGADVQPAVGSEADPPAVVKPLRRDPIEEHLLLARGTRVRREHPARQPVHRAPALLDGRVQVEPPVLREARIRRHAEEPSLPLLGDLQRRDRLGHELPALQEPHPSRPLGDEGVAARQEGDAPRHLEPGDDPLDADRDGAPRPKATLDERAARRGRTLGARVAAGGEERGDRGPRSRHARAPGPSPAARGGGASRSSSRRCPAVSVMSRAPRLKVA